MRNLTTQFSANKQANGLFNQAIALFQENRMHESEEVLRNNLAQYPTHSASLHLLGVMMQQQGKMLAAIADPLLSVCDFLSRE